MDDQDAESPTDDDELVQDGADDAFDWGAEGAPEEDREPDVVRFDLCGQAFAVDAGHVIEVGSPPALTDVPGLPPHVIGVAVRRRHVLSVVDLTMLLELDPTKFSALRLLVFDVNGLEVGALVGNVPGLEVWPDEAEQPKQPDLVGALKKYVSGTRWAPGGRVLLLDLPELLRDAAVR